MDDLREALAAQQSEFEQLRIELARREGHIDALEAQLKVRLRWDEGLRQTAENLDAHLLARDKEIAERRGEQSLREEVKWRRETEEALRESLRQTEEALGGVIDGLQQKLATVERTRLWRWGQRYWQLKAAVRGALRRDAPCSSAPRRSHARRRRCHTAGR
jgi:chromosome segregation ATPase